jgi:hypothetical protein
MSEAEPLFRRALNQFQDKIRAAITRVGIDDGMLRDFVDEFASAFAQLLIGHEGESVWRRDGKDVRELGRYLGTMAEMFAVTEAMPGHPIPVEVRHLRKALAVIKPICKLPLPASALVQRHEYCAGVSIHPEVADASLV